MFYATSLTVYQCVVSGPSPGQYNASVLGRHNFMIQICVVLMYCLILWSWCKTCLQINVLKVNLKHSDSWPIQLCLKSSVFISEKKTYWKKIGVEFCALYPLIMKYFKFQDKDFINCLFYYWSKVFLLYKFINYKLHLCLYVILSWSKPWHHISNFGQKIDWFYFYHIDIQVLNSISNIKKEEGSTRPTITTHKIFSIPWNVWCSKNDDL